MRRRIPARTCVARLRRLLTRAAPGGEGVPGAMLYVDAPSLKFRWAGASGEADVRSGAPLTPGHSVRIASITKSFVAVATLRLSEKGLLSIEDSVEQHLSPESTGILASGGYSTKAVTIRQLLGHTSGIFDYGMAATYDKLVRDTPTRRWTRVEQLRGAVEWGQPYGAPGNAYAYSDTGYILLGEIIERVTGKTLAAALRELVDYNALKLTSTWLETMEPKPSAAQDRAHQYLDDADTFDWDPSMDLYGGGGLVSTVADLGRYFRGLFAGNVFANPETLRLMLAPVPVAVEAKAAAGRYGLGIRIVEVDGLAVYGHGGYWGTSAGYVPALDLSLGVAATRRGASESSDALFRDTIRIMRKAIGGSGGRRATLE